MWSALVSFVPRQPSKGRRRQAFGALLALSLLAGVFPGNAQAADRLGAGERAAPVFQQTADVGTTIRFEGADRIQTAVAIADSLYNEANVGFIVLASSEQFPDALSGGSLAATLRGPLLLTQSTQLHPLVLQAMKRYAPPGTADVVMMGGERALSAGVEQQVAEAGYTVRRIGGSNRYATAARAASSFGTPDTIYLADGDVFGDALIAAAVAGVTGAVVLTSGTRMPEETRAYLTSLPNDVPVTPIGRAAATTMPKNASIYGDSVYETSAMVATTLFPDFETVGLASGEDFPDGLAGASHAAAQNFPLLLTERDRAPDVVVEAVAERTRELAYIYGGPAAISSEITVQIGRSNTFSRCEIFSLDCKHTLSRTATRSLCETICSQGVAGVTISAGAAAYACSAIGTDLVGLVCGTAVEAAGLSFYFDLQGAADQGQCLQIHFYYVVGDPRAVVNPTSISDGPDCDRAGSAEESLS